MTNLFFIEESARGLFMKRITELTDRHKQIFRTGNGTLFPYYRVDESDRI